MPPRTTPASSRRDAGTPAGASASQAAGQPAASNVLELTVGELSGALKRTIEDRFGFVRVRGEVSNFRGQHSSGHAYFCLKDDAARIDAVIWKTAYARLKVKPEEGMDVIATGRVTTFPGKSSYQIVIESIEPAGIGALMALLEQRRKTLAAEGLFDEARKRRLPYLPRTIGVVTSPTGAVIRDILHRLEDRFPRDVLVWPVRVQGETAAAEVAAAIDGFNVLPADGRITRPDVLIVARGGGSLEDLWAFNEEIVVRAAAASAIPLIAAIGHETDWTLIDHVADLRAPTPSGAAEKAVPVRGDLLTQVADLARRHGAAEARLIERRRQEMRALARALPAAESVTAMPRQRLDRAHDRLRASAAGLADRRHLDLSRLANRLSRQAPRTRLAHQARALAALEQRMGFCLERTRDRAGQRLAGAAQRLARAADALGRELPRASARGEEAARKLEWSFGLLLTRRRERLERYAQLLNSLGYRQVLARGFALVRGPDGNPVHQACDIRPASILDIEFADGHIEAIAGGTAAPRKPREPRAASAAATSQGKLF